MPLLSLLSFCPRKTVFTAQNPKYSMPLPRQQQTDRFDLRALYETSRLLSASLDLEFVLNNLLLTTMSKLLVTRGAAMLFDPVENAYRAASIKGLPSLQNTKWHKIGDIPTDRMLADAEVPEALAQHRIELVLPVAFGHRRIGLIGLGKKATGQPFESRELEFVQSLVNMSSSAVHNSLMVEELKQANRDLDTRIQQLNTLFDLSQEFNATLDRDRLLKILSFALMGQMLVGKYLFLLRHEGPDGGFMFETVAAKGVRGEVNAALAEALLNSKDLVLLQDDEAETDSWSALKGLGLVLALPLRQHNETGGVLCLGPKMTRQPYSTDDIEFLYALGNLAFVTMQNLHLVEEQIEKERLEKEMRLARTIQEGLLPSSIPRHPGLDVAAMALPSREVGGDYYDVIQLDEYRLLLAIADVTGKGVPAALLMANLQACLHTMVPMDIKLEESTAHMNRVICGNTGYDKFITFFTAIYDRRTNHFEYVNAGHDPPMLVRANGDIEELEKGGLLLGVMKGMPYERGQVTLHPGDLVAMFTDGVTEAMSPENEEYTPERLQKVLLGHHQKPAQEVLDCVQGDICVHTGDITVLSDDRTMIVLKVEDDHESQT